MDSVKRYPVLTAVLALCVAAFAVEAFFLWRFSTQVTVVQRNLDDAHAAAQALERTSPAPTDENKTAALNNVADLQAALDKVTNTLQNTPIKITNVPTSGPDLLVAIQSYVTNLRAKAKARNVVLPSPDFDFGMSMYFGTVAAPPVDKIPAVYTQMKVLDYILGHLMGDAKMNDEQMMIVSVMRENVAAPPASSASALSLAPDQGGDLFVIPPTITARGPGLDTLAFEIQFISYTDSLRLLLSDLKNFEMPLVVRSVEAVPADESTILAAANGGNVPAPTPAQRAQAKAAAAIRKPVVSQNLSQFTLIIEYVQLPQAPAAPAAAADGTAAPVGTAAPAATSH